MVANQEVESRLTPLFRRDENLPIPYDGMGPMC